MFLDGVLDGDLERVGGLLDGGLECWVGEGWVYGIGDAVNFVVLLHFFYLPLLVCLLQY